ncbi:betaine-aldehyde dehydrogenase [Aestuariispira ectoiniformans]|uniref:betaine-aldehyde dehydrogenase n=1 Tax=Aestuariispira ectoiniformans TaxID=2775080 RepID=UPI00223B6B84|nr:betaine-aldehyde dehydrogenase [Aestuariispira ectoiniformans]
MTTLPEVKLYIGGEYVDATSGQTFDNVNPATGEVICKVQIASDADVNRAIEAAKQAQKAWAKTTGAERGRILNRAVALIRERNQELSELEVLDTGKPLQEAVVADAASGADCIEYFAGAAALLKGDHYDLGGSFAYTRREPLGVCAGIGAWNYPIQIACWKSGPALACGNAMVYKPSEMTPLTAMKLAEIYTEAGLPAGLFNVVNGYGPVGAALSTHPDVDKVSLTGSVPTGKKVLQGASETLKHVTLELGGKSPLIVFADADLDNAVSAAMLANFYTQGEICSNGTRVFVEESVHNQFIEKLVSRTEKMKIGDPMDMETHVGSLISEDHMNKVLGYIEAGKKAGAQIATGGNRYTANGCDKGFYVEPTVFTQCGDEMDIVREEIFGPVMSVLTFKTEEEAVRRANDTDFGLAAGVFTKDIMRGHRVVAELEAGTCWINNYNLTPIEMPFGGYKHSGIGRENSQAAIEHYTQLKSVYVEMGDVDAPY